MHRIRYFCSSVLQSDVNIYTRRTVNENLYYVRSKQASNSNKMDDKMRFIFSDKQNDF